MRVRTFFFLFLFLFLVGAHPASADWLFTPFIGSSFGTTTTFVVVETGADTSKLMFGGSAALLSRGVLGVEADFGYGPRFFERDKRAGDITGSNVTTLTGNVIVAVPLSVSRESLRPYLVGGLGLIHAAAQTSIDFLPFNDNMLGSSVGGGAIGLISPRSGFRFELRHLRSLKNSPSELTGENGARLSFWRATVGVIVRLSN